MVGDHALRLGKHVGSLVNMVVVLRPEPRCENNNHGIIRQQTPSRTNFPLRHFLALLVGAGAGRLSLSLSSTHQGLAYRLNGIDDAGYDLSRLVPHDGDGLAKSTCGSEPARPTLCLIELVHLDNVGGDDPFEDELGYPVSLIDCVVEGEGTGRETFDEKRRAQPGFHVIIAWGSP